MALEFFKDRKDFFTPLLLLAISMGVLVFNSMPGAGHRINPFSRLVLTLISYPQRTVNGTLEGVSYTWKHYVQLRNAQNENDALHKQINELEMRRQALVEENGRLQMGIKSLPWPDTDFLSASIIGLSPNEEYRVITINIGSSMGVHYGMPVVTGGGVVGKIVGEGSGRQVPPRSATVLLLLDPRCRIDALVYRFNQPATSADPAAPPPAGDPACPWNPVNWQQTRVRGVAVGDQNKLLLKFVSRDADVKQGDRVVSSGLGGVFPKGLLIGIVTRVVPAEVGLSPYIEITPAVDFSRLEEVQVMVQKGAPAP